MNSIIRWTVITTILLIAFILFFIKQNRIIELFHSIYVDILLWPFF